MEQRNCGRLTKSYVADQGVRYMIWNYSDHHNQNQYQNKPPVKEARRRLQNTNDLENYQLEERQTEGEGDRKYELDANVLDFIVLEELLHEKDNSAEEKQNLRGTFQNKLCNCP